MHGFNPTFMFNIILTPQNNAIIRQADKKKIFIVRGYDLKTISGKKITNHGLALKLSYRLTPTLQVEGTFKEAQKRAQSLIMERRYG